RRGGNCFSGFPKFTHRRTLRLRAKSWGRREACPPAGWQRDSVQNTSRGTPTAAEKREVGRGLWAPRHIPSAPRAAGRAGMDRLRLAPLSGSASYLMHCGRCAVGPQKWDRIGDQAYCANCQEELAQGIGAALVVRTEASRCVVCARRGTVRYMTVPLHAKA